MRYDILIMLLLIIIFDKCVCYIYFPENYNTQCNNYELAFQINVNISDIVSFYYPHNSFTAPENKTNVNMK